MWRLCGVIIKIHFSDPQLNFGSVLEIHFLFIFEIQNLPYSHIVKITRSYGQNHPEVRKTRPEGPGRIEERSELRLPGSKKFNEE